jgi:hypothetical protein
MNNGDRPAAPLDSGTRKAVEDGFYYETLGLTKREHFSAMAMQSIIGKHVPESQSDLSLTADLSLRCADALLKALETQL